MVTSISMAQLSGHTALSHCPSLVCSCRFDTELYRSSKLISQLLPLRHWADRGSGNDHVPSDVWHYCSGACAYISCD
jgi:hypothetical protein